MDVSLNESFLRKICGYLNTKFSGMLSHGLTFRPGQIVKDEVAVAVFPQGYTDRVDFVDGGFRESFVFTLMMRTSGERSASRYRICEMLNHIAENLKTATDFLLGEAYEFLYFDRYSGTELISRGINGEEVYAMKMLMRYDRKGTW